MSSSLLRRGLSLGPEQAGVELLDHALDGHERQDFVLREPEAGQFGGVLRGVQPVAAQVAVEHDGCAQAVTELGNVALEGGGRDFERGQNVFAWQSPAVAEQGFVAVEAVDFGHQENRCAAGSIQKLYFE